MVDFNPISLALLTLLLAIILFLCYIDYRRKRVLGEKPFLSFIIPCYNDGATIKETIESIYHSYDKSLFEIIVVNDGSSDNSLEILKKIRERYAFTLINNKENLGKSRSVNNVFTLAKSEMLFFLDADVIIAREGVTDVLARLQEENVAAVSCPYKPRNKGFLPLMLEMEYNMISLIQGSYNCYSTIALWGGCFVVKKRIFEEVHALSENAIVEDLDLALKLNRAGYKVEQSFYPVLTYVPDTLTSWYHQKKRWSSGGMQCFIEYFDVWRKNPLLVIFIVLFSILSISFIFSLLKEILFFNGVIESYQLLANATTTLLSFKILGLYYGAQIVKNLAIALYFTIFSFPYIVPMITHFKQMYRIILVFPFSLLYYPLLSLVSIYGFIIGIIKYRSLKKGGRAW